MAFSEISDDDKKKVYSYSFIVRLLPQMEDTEIRSMFRRLNRNVVALNQQELRHATYWRGFIKTMEGIADDERWSDFAVFTPNDVRRMLDIEFISELAIGYLHGVQNKKSTLENWYEAYEKDFPQRRHILSFFNIVLGEINQVIPDLNKTRWRKKSDFYSLFLVFSHHENELLLDRQNRNEINKKLASFATNVDSYISNTDSPNIAANAKRYVEAVEKAATDLANRRKRHEIIESLIFPTHTQSA